MRTEAGRLGGWEAGRPGGWEAGKLIEVIELIANSGLLRPSYFSLISPNITSGRSFRFEASSVKPSVNQLHNYCNDSKPLFPGGFP